MATTVFTKSGLTVASITRNTVNQVDSGIVTVTDSAGNTIPVVIPWATAQTLSIGATYTATLTTP